MGKRKYADVKNKAVQDELRRQAEIMGIKEDDLMLKESLENVVNTKGSSKGRNFLLKQELDKLDKYINSLSKDEVENSNGDLHYEDNDFGRILDDYEYDDEYDDEYGDEYDDEYDKWDMDILKDIVLEYGTDFAKSTVSFGKKQIENVVDMFKNREKIKESIVDKYDKWKYGDIDYTGKKKVSYSEYLETSYEDMLDSYMVSGEKIEAVAKAVSKGAKNIAKGAAMGVGAVAGAGVVAAGAVAGAGMTAISYGVDFAKSTVSLGQKQINNVLDFVNKGKEYCSGIKEKIANKYEKVKEDVKLGVNKVGSYVEEQGKETIKNTLGFDNYQDMLESYVASGESIESGAKAVTKGAKNVVKGAAMGVGAVAGAGVMAAGAVAGAGITAVSYGVDFTKSTVGFGKKQINNVVNMFKNREEIKESIIDKYDKWKYGDIDYTGEKKVSYSEYLETVDSSIKLIESGTGYVYNNDGKGGYTKTLMLDGKEINTVESSKDEYLSAQKESFGKDLGEKEVDKDIERNFRDMEK